MRSDSSSAHEVRRPAGDLFWGTSGPRDSAIAIVGEAWGREEEVQREPFVGESGKEFQRMFAEAGLDWSSTFKTNCFPFRPPDNDASLLFLDNQTAKTIGAERWKGLYAPGPTKFEVSRMYRQLEAVKPKVVIASGNYALWALTERCSASNVSLGNGVTVLAPSGIMSWRGSMIYSESTPFPSTPVLPIIHPAAILRAWYNRAVTVHDLAERVPQALSGDWRPRNPPRMLAPPSFEEACHWLHEWLRIMDKRPLRLVADIETKGSLIICIGFADSASFAMVIPFARMETGGSNLESYWSRDCEAILVQLIRRLFFHKNLRLEGQNFIYDTQYIYKYWGVTPRLDFDTMLAHHLLFPGTPKGLDYLSSLYCRHHWYWKEDGKEWDTRHQGFSQLLAYNAMDCVRTFECATVLRDQITKNGLTEQWEWEKRKADLALRMMIRGINVDRTLRSRIGFELLAALSDIHASLEKIVPPGAAWDEIKSKKPWYVSPKQTLFVFSHILGFPVQYNRKTSNPTVDDEALEALERKRPEFKKLFSLLSQKRSVGVFSSNFLSAPLDSDGRMRCSYNPAGTATFRWSSSENAFGGGTNLQNIPKGTED